MNRDCDIFCWQYTHLNHAIRGLCIIFCLNFSIVLYKFIHSQKNLYRNILILPLYAYIKVLFQIVLSVLSIILKVRFAMIFNSVFSLLMIGNLIISYKLRIYNFKRIQLIEIFTISGVVWSVLLTTIFEIAAEGEVNLELKTLFITL